MENNRYLSEQGVLWERSIDEKSTEGVPVQVKNLLTGKKRRSYGNQRKSSKRLSTGACQE